jgi:hypothetical protein
MNNIILSLLINYLHNFMHLYLDIYYIHCLQNVSPILPRRSSKNAELFYSPLVIPTDS